MSEKGRKGVLATLVHQAKANQSRFDIRLSAIREEFKSNFADCSHQLCDLSIDSEINSVLFENSLRKYLDYVRLLINMLMARSKY